MGERERRESKREGGRERDDQRGGGGVAGGRASPRFRPTGVFGVITPQRQKKNA